MGKRAILTSLIFMVVCGQWHLQAQDSAAVDFKPAFKEQSAILGFGVGIANMYPQILVTKLSNANADMHRNYTSTLNTYTFTTSAVLNRDIKLEFSLNKNTGVQLLGNFLGVNATELHTYYVAPSTGTVNIKYCDTSTIAYRSLSIGLRFNYHYAIGSNVDAYVGAGGGISIDDFYTRFGSNNPNFISTSLNFEKMRPVPAFYSITAGLRLYLTHAVAWYVETGIDKWTVLHTGISIKLI